MIERPQRVRRLLVVLAVMSVAGAGLGVAMSSAGALPSNCLQSANVVTCTLTYNGTNGIDGSVQSFMVPAEVTHVTVEAWGAQGGDVDAGVLGGGFSGAPGGHVKGTVPVTPLETLTVRVGGWPQVQASGGFNGGGNAHGLYCCLTAGGGGASDVRQGGDGLANRILVAGGGGGAGVHGYFPPMFPLGGDSGGGGGGVSGGNGACPSACAGGGTQTQGGTGGTSSCVPTTPGSVTNGTDGSAGMGGEGGSANCPVLAGLITASGGGGGFFGGGGGGALVECFSSNCVLGFEPGGGGSGYVTPAATLTTNQAGINTGNGKVTITYTLPTPGNIFATTFKRCTTLHVGYNRFVNGTIIHWRVTTNGVGTVASGQFSAIGGGVLGSKTYHFLDIPLATTLPSDASGIQSHVLFTWVDGGRFYATRDPGC